MINDRMLETASNYLDVLCSRIGERPVGSEGNRKATAFFEKEISLMGWNMETQEFEATDWIEGGAILSSGEDTFEVFVSPYSLGCDLEAGLAAAGTISELENVNANGKILLLHGDIAKEQLMPKNFVFYNPEEHQKVISLLEASGARAIVTATGRNSSLAGGKYPFPLIEDGDFDIPSVYLTDKEGERLLKHEGRIVSLKSISERIPGKGCNVIARKGKEGAQRIVITAHIDAKKGTPGAIDNATGVTLLLLLAEKMKDYNGSRQIEIVALNGEDYYAVSGQMKYIQENQGKFSEIAFNLNIDGLGYFEGETAYSLYNFPDDLKGKAEDVFSGFKGICRGAEWPQGDHSIFVQFGCPAMAFTSMWFTDNMETQDVTHTEKDNLSIVDPKKLVAASCAISEFLLRV